MSNARLGEPSTGIHESFTSEDTVGYTVHMHEMPMPERSQASTKAPRQRKAASGLANLELVMCLLVATRPTVCRSQGLLGHPTSFTECRP